MFDWETTVRHLYKLFSPLQYMFIFCHASLIHILNIIYMYPCLKKYLVYFWSFILIKITCSNNVSWPRTILNIIEPITFCYFWLIRLMPFLRLLFSNRHRRFTPPFMYSIHVHHISQSLNLIVIMLNQRSSCENSLSYLVAPRPQYIYNFVWYLFNLHLYVICMFKLDDLIWLILGKNS